MAGVLKLEIHESVEDLKQLMQEQTEPAARAKIQVLWWVKSGQVTSLDEAADLSGYHRVTLSRWFSQYRKGGIDALLEVGQRTGRPRALPSEIVEELRRELQDPEGFNGYTEVQRWLYAVHGMKVPYKTVHQTVRYHLKSKLKRGRPVSERQEPGAVEEFQKNFQN